MGKADNKQYMVDLYLGVLMSPNIVRNSDCIDRTLFGFIILKISNNYQILRLFFTVNQRLHRRSDATREHRV